MIYSGLDGYILPFFREERKDDTERKVNFQAESEVEPQDMYLGMAFQVTFYLIIRSAVNMPVSRKNIRS